MESMSNRPVVEESARSWLARFSPYVYALSVSDAADCRAQLERLRGLRSEAGPLLSALEAEADVDPALSGTMRQAVDTLGSIEDDLRRRLGKLAPGDADALVDLDDLRERLAERAARAELGESEGLSEGAVWSHCVSGGNWGAAAAMLGFGTAWNAFTGVHATFMIGGMAQAFGWPAYFLLLFYALFFGAGLSMWAGGVESACRQELEMDGSRLTTVKTLGRWVRRRSWDLDPLQEAAVVDGVQRLASGGFSFQTNGRVPVGGVRVTDTAGKDVWVGQGLDAARLDILAKRINAQLMQARSSGS